MSATSAFIYGFLARGGYITLLLTAIAALRPQWIWLNPRQRREEQ